MDWYRLHDPLELDMLDWEGLTQDYPLILVEWPGRLADYAADFDLFIQLTVCGAGRAAEFQAHSPFAKGLVQHFHAF
jgi:tRNA A37 threonylcarbamoyladenosine biosynthesis protein TsaE